MSPWRIIFDAIGWLIIASVVGACLVSLWSMVTGYARDLWDARGEAPHEHDYTTTSNREPRP